MKRSITYFSLILAFATLGSCAQERKTSLGSDSIGIIGYSKPVRHAVMKEPVNANIKTINHQAN
jgi:hypothetical protein